MKTAIVLTVSLVISILLTAGAAIAQNSPPSNDMTISFESAVHDAKFGEEIFVRTVAEDPDGCDDFKWVLLYFFPQVDPESHPTTGFLYLVADNCLRVWNSDTGYGPKMPITIDEDTYLENDYVKLSCMRSRVEMAGNALNAVFAATFKEPYKGELFGMRQFAMDISGNKVATNLGVLKITEKAPRFLAFQGMLKDNIKGDSIDGTVDVTFRLYETAVEGAPLWKETQTGLEVKNGLLNAELGGVVSLDAVPFDRQYWLGVEVGSDGEMVPRFKLTSVPYSFRSD